MPPTDPRFLDATAEEIIEDYWANVQADRIAAGKGDEEEIEDDDFDLDQILTEMEDNPDAWEDALGIPNGAPEA